MSRANPTYNQLLAIQLHLISALKNVGLLHSRNEQICVECGVAFPCLTYTIINDQCKHIEIHLEKVEKIG